jgi:hypothetical protein
MTIAEADSEQCRKNSAGREAERQEFALCAVERLRTKFSHCEAREGTDRNRNETPLDKWQSGHRDLQKFA